MTIYDPYADDDKISMVSKTLGYNSKWENPMPGDLVMTTARRIKHPALRAGMISNPNFLIFGSVKYFTYVDWDTGRKDDEWDGVVRSHERIRVDWMHVEGIDNWPVNPPAHKWVDVIAKKTNGSVTGMNVEIKRMAERFFYHDSKEGWKRRVN